MSPRTRLAPWLRMATVVLLAICGGVPAASQQPPGDPGPTTELEIQDLQVGDGEIKARPGDQLEVTYRCWLAGVETPLAVPTEPFTFRLGVDRLLPGWHRGLEGMRVGGRRFVKIPPQLAYGDAGYGELVPPDATLLFEVELLALPREGDGIWHSVTPGLRILDLERGDTTAPAAVEGSRISAHYVGWLEDGTRFDSSHERGVPYDFLLGKGQVIRGWELGLQGMHPGGRRKLEVEAPLAYGSRGTSDGRIPGGATLLYEVLVLEVTPPLAGDPTYLDPEQLVVTASGLQYVDLVQGQGDAPAPGSRVTVHYVGRLGNGKVFDSTRDREKPFTFTLGRGQVIKGWEEALPTMRAGGVRRLKIPPQLGYGRRGIGRIVPPGATIFFDVELLSVGSTER